MLDFFSLKIHDGLAQFRIGIAKRVQLLRIMPVDLGFDSSRAGHRRFRTNDCACCAQRKTGDVPEGLEKCRPNLAASHHRIEMVEMAVFLHRHMLDLPCHGMAIPQNGELPGIDAGRAIFACLIDAQHGGAIRTGPTRPWGGSIRHAVLRLKTKTKIARAPLSEKMALKPASEIPPSVHWGTSQRTSGVFMMLSSEIPPLLAAQVVSPSHHPYSTPA